MKILLTTILLCCIAGTTLLAQQHLTIKRDGFSLNYPADWKIDTEDEDYDPDALFSIDSPDGENMIMFILFTEPVDAENLLQAQVDAFSGELVKKPEITSFNSWGNYKGEGKLLKGKLLGVFNGFVRIFVYGDENKTMLVVEQCYDKAYDTLKKDYDLMASSFRFN